jgi:RNA polymerase sigma-70 factor (ECF subfamily)
MLTNKDLAALLARVALSDRAAFEQVYRATCAHLLGVAFRILNNRERAEEVLQEAFMNVWHSAGGFDASVAGPMTWLINIVRNEAIDALRSGRTERASTFALDDEALAVAADEAQQPQVLLDQSLAKLKIIGCMGELGASQRPEEGDCAIQGQRQQGFIDLLRRKLLLHGRKAQISALLPRRGSARRWVSCPSPIFLSPVGDRRTVAGLGSLGASWSVFSESR